jgi:hypothetical protein
MIHNGRVTFFTAVRRNDIGMAVGYSLNFVNNG